MEGFEVRQSIDLARENGVLRRAQPIERGDVKALRWIVTVTRNGEPEDLSGGDGRQFTAREPTHRQCAAMRTSSSMETLFRLLPQDAATHLGWLSANFDCAWIGWTGICAGTDDA